MPCKKIWEIENSYKCILVGVCLSRSELRALSKDRRFDLDSGQDDYVLHSCFIRIAGREDAQGKALHKYLERKFKEDARKYLQVAAEPELMALWEADLSEGKVESAWWGILTHPAASAEFVRKVYGMLHMLSHEAVRYWRRDRVRLAALRSRISMLEQVIGSERQQYRRERRQWEEEIRLLHRQGMDAAQDGHSAPEATGEGADMEEGAKTESAALHNRIQALEMALAEAGTRLETGERRLQEWENLYAGLLREKEAQTRETALLESLLARRDDGGPCCRQCEDQHTGNCPGPDLCGRTILYVGGLHKMVPRYRQLVEQCGGRFIHHDGGKEASRSLLSGMLLTADAVLCPIDCVSHDACLRVKRMCKRYQKPFVPMRSAGLSSLARGLNDIVQ